MSIYNDCICKAFYEPKCEVHGPKPPTCSIHGLKMTDAANCQMWECAACVCSHKVLVNDNVGMGGAWRCEACGKRPLKKATSSGKKSER